MDCLWLFARPCLSATVGGETSWLFARPCCLLRSVEKPHGSLLGPVCPLRSLEKPQGPLLGPVCLLRSVEKTQNTQCHSGIPFFNSCGGVVSMITLKVFFSKYAMPKCVRNA